MLQIKGSLQSKPRERFNEDTGTETKQIREQMQTNVRFNLTDSKMKPNEPSLHSRMSRQS
jgi:hypothetical protein